MDVESTRDPVTLVVDEGCNGMLRVQRGVCLRRLLLETVGLLMSSVEAARQGLAWGGPWVRGGLRRLGEQRGEGLVWGPQADCGSDVSPTIFVSNHLGAAIHAKTDKISFQDPASERTVL